ncbi:unnamed protein product [Spirodela intermedia]|uniref:Uncharacterized protein n=1 Tax=Spirodela intermedia TaxID=51605 RepID=A0A7I8JCK2_SPIIN|nr:unnamed protein product [Spirodela intermedia]CAA6667721.1 unnamed protein product [Spirodela intermedia]
MNTKKCQFQQPQLEYLGHWISARVFMDKRKNSAIWDWPTPKNLKALQGFLGLTDYYHIFVKCYATLSLPLTRLLRKKYFRWESDAQEAFNKLKVAITSRLVLALPNFSQTFIKEHIDQPHGN